MLEGGRDSIRTLMFIRELPHSRLDLTHKETERVSLFVKDGDLKRSRAVFRQLHPICARLQQYLKDIDHSMLCCKMKGRPTACVYLYRWVGAVCQEELSQISVPF